MLSYDEMIPLLSTLLFSTKLTTAIENEQDTSFQKLVYIMGTNTKGAEMSNLCDPYKCI